MKTIAAALAALTLLAVAAEAQATDRRTPAEKPEVPARTADAPKQRTKPYRADGLTWRRGLANALKTAERRRRPVFLVRMLGELDGKT